MTVHILEEQELEELKSILKLIKSSDLETVKLGLGLLRQYPYSMRSEFDSSMTSFKYPIGFFVLRGNIYRVINTLEEIIEDKKYYSDLGEKLVQTYDY